MQYGLKIFYILHTLTEKYGRNNIDLYRYEGLAYFENTAEPRTEEAFY